MVAFEIDRLENGHVVGSWVLVARFTLLQQLGWYSLSSRTERPPATG
ncbi:hypothetical protein SAMN05444422_11732 [Halobiforma haloterrestris]|uniref:Uncharacterized protein n=1 Tax=Natronobacterium haloterrestre TaxID=148448 RepID=A0A1I1LTH4_NATHA|nr:hypothetical protein SAMN05444422_11732 [Halobiforma haloterrestris]